MSTENRGLNSRATQAANLVAGAKKRLPNGSQQIPVGGTSMTVDQVTGQLQALVTNRSAVTAAQATTSAKLAVERAQAPSLIAIMVAFVTFIRLTFGEQADVLADFGLTPPKPKAQPTAEVKAIAAAKRAATRAARGTTSKKARA